MEPSKKIDKLISLCENYQCHLNEALEKSTRLDNKISLEHKLEAINELLNVCRERTLISNEQCLRNFSEQLKSAREVISKNRGADDLGVIFLKTVATILSLGAILLVNRFNFWKSQGERKCTQMDTILEARNESSKLLSSGDTAAAQGKEPESANKQHLSISPTSELP